MDRSHWEHSRTVLFVLICQLEPELLRFKVAKKRQFSESPKSNCQRCIYKHFARLISLQIFIGHTKMYLKPINLTYLCVYLKFCFFINIGLRATRAWKWPIRALDLAKFCRVTYSGCLIGIFQCSISQKIIQVCYLFFSEYKYRQNTIDLWRQNGFINTTLKNTDIQICSNSTFYQIWW